jgi:hypothetical protein
MAFGDRTTELDRGIIRQPRTEAKHHLPTKTHPDFPDQPIMYDQTGKAWLDLGGSYPSYVYGPYFLDKFKLADVVTNKEKSLDTMLDTMQPLQEENKRFFNASALEGISDTTLDMSPRNVNADLGCQERIRLMKEKGIIDEHTFVLLSHGHMVAGLAELTKMTTTDNKYMFDTTLYFPRGGWLPGIGEANDVVKEGLQLWSEEIKKAKEENQQRESAGGIAVGIFGHRGRTDMRDVPRFPTAAINPEQLLGNTDEYMEFLNKHNLNKVVIITEESDINPSHISSLPLDRLKEGYHQNENKDLFAYFQTLKEKGVNVLVVSGDSRPAKGALAEQLVKDDIQREIVDQR